MATSICSRFLEDDSSFVYFLGGPPAEVTKLKAESNCHFDRPRPGSVRVFTSQWQHQTGKMRAWSIIRTLGRALHSCRGEILIRGVATAADRIAVALEVAPPGATGFA